MSSYLTAGTGHPSPPHGEATGSGVRPPGPSFRGRCLRLRTLPFLSTPSMSTTRNSTDTFPLLLPHPPHLARSLALSLFNFGSSSLGNGENAHLITAKQQVRRATEPAPRDAPFHFREALCPCPEAAPCTCCRARELAAPSLGAPQIGLSRSLPDRSLGVEMLRTRARGL